jgi:hypothetical protein
MRDRRIYILPVGVKVKDGGFDLFLVVVVASGIA